MKIVDVKEKGTRRWMSSGVFLGLGVDMEVTIGGGLARSIEVHVRMWGSASDGTESTSRGTAGNREMEILRAGISWRFKDTIYITK